MKSNYSSFNKKVEEPQKIKEISLQLLADFDAFCRANNLKYTLTQGTLLGAVRHKGIIPWDDDIDVAMFREDYDKLIALSKTMPDNCVFINHDTDKSYSRLYGRICNKNYLSVDKYYCNATTNYYGVDIFPIEEVPENADEYYKFAKKLRILRQMYIFSNSAVFKGINFLRAYIIKPIPIIICKLIGRNRIYKMFYNIVNKYKGTGSNTLAILTGEYVFKENFLKDDYLKFIDLPFEENERMCIEEYHKYLSKIYGDYMKLPPEEKRVNRHNFNLYTKI